MKPKSDDLSQVSNWRPIAILRIMYKIFAKMLYCRLCPLLEGSSSVDQCTYRKNYGMEDCLFIMQLLWEQAREFNIPLWIGSLDLRKAFDSIEVQAILNALVEIGLDPGYIDLIQLLYSN